VLGRDIVGGCNADRAHRDVNRARFESRKQALLPRQHRLQRGIVAEHREHDFLAGGRLAGTRGRAGAERNEGTGLIL